MRIPLTTVGEMFWLGENRVPFNFAFTARIRGPFSRQDLERALRQAADRHPLSRVRLEVDAQGKEWLSTFGSVEIPLRIVTTGRAWEDVVEAELACPFDPFTGPQVRAALIAGSPGGEDAAILILVFNHNAGDGMSGAYFTRDVLQFLGQPDAALPLPGSGDDDLMRLIPRPAGAGMRMRLQLWAINKLAPLAWVVQKRLPRPAQPEVVPGFRLLTWAMSPEFTAALIARCRIESTSVHAAVCAAWLRADAEIANEWGNHPRWWHRRRWGRARCWQRSVSTPVNLRDCLSEPVGDSFGLFMSTITTRIDCSPDREFWEIARAIKRRLTRDLSGYRKFHWALRTQAALRGLSRVDRKGALALLSAHRPGYDLAVTNLGRLDFPNRSGSLYIEALYGPLVNGFPFERTVSVLTFNGVMHFAFAFRAFVLDGPTANRIRERAMEILSQAAGCPE